MDVTILSLLRDLALSDSLQHIIVVMILLMALDILSGIVKAFKQKKINSEIGIRGITQKAASIILLLALHIVTFVIPGGPPLAVSYGIAYSLFELVSIVENVAETGAPMPPYILGLLKVFDNLQQISDKENDK